MKFIIIFTGFDIQTVFFPWKVSALFKELKWFYASKTPSSGFCPKVAVSFLFPREAHGDSIYSFLDADHVSSFIVVVNILSVYYIQIRILIQGS